MSEKRWLVTKRGLPLGTVEARDWYLAREAAAVKYKTSRDSLTLTRVKDRAAIARIGSFLALLKSTGAEAPISGYGGFVLRARPPKRRKKK